MKNITKRLAFINDTLFSNATSWAKLVFGFLAGYDIMFFVKNIGQSDLISNVMFEIHGLLFDLIILGWIIASYDTKRQKREQIERDSNLKIERIERDKNLINDFREWDEKEATFRIRGAIRRLRDLGESKLDLRNCYFRKAIMVGENLKEALLMGADLRGAKLFEANLDGALLIGAKMQDANLKDASLIKANLMSANLEATDFTGAILEGATFQGAQFQPKLILPGNAELTWALFGKRGTIFKDSNLKKAYLRNLNLQFVNLSGADLTEAFVDRDWFDKLDEWEVIGKEEIVRKYRIDENGILQLR